MASDDDSQALDTHHDEKDWEAQKENFRICYLDANRTRKEAAEYMKRHYNFNATPRQWERKIKQWGFSKYTNRDERLTQIAQAGKTVLDVSRPGRRPRTLVDEYGNLQPHEDRNLRRFARREVSRSRSRSRSASFNDRPRPHFKHEFSDPSANTTMDSAFNSNEFASDPRRTPSREGSPMPGMQPVRERAVSLQHNFFQQPGMQVSHDQQSLAAGGQNQWDQAQHHGSPPYQATPALNQFNAFPSAPIPMHASQGMSFQSTDPAFAGPGSGAPFGYHIQDPTLQTIPTGFNNFPIPENSMGLHQDIMPEDLMTEQAMFDSTIQIPQGSEGLDETGFENNPMIRFDIVDMDSPAMMPAAGPAQVQSQPVVSMPSSEQIMGDNGPLGTDVFPLVEQYTRAVQAITLGALTGSSHADVLSGKLANDLEQPSRAFMASMSIFLDNFTKTQQRSLQSMKDTCSKLRQKNAMYEQILHGGADMDPLPSIEHDQHRSSISSQPAMYGAMYSQNY